MSHFSVNFQEQSFQLPRHCTMSAVNVSSGRGTLSYKETSQNLMTKYRLPKRSTNSTNLKRVIEKHLAKTKITMDKFLDYGPNSMLYLCTQNSTGKQMVLKILLKRIIENAGGVVMKRPIDYDKLNPESSVASIAWVHEFASMDSTAYSLVTEYYPKGSLAKLIESSGPLQETVAQGIFGSALAGLGHMHSNKMAHRNLKLENLLLDEHNRAVVSDFNYSLIVSESAQMEAVYATSLPYLAPEIFANVPYDPIIADCWSFGICMYIALNDCLPFGPSGKPLPGCESFFALKPSVDVSLSGEVKKLLKLMLQSDVNKRATTYILQRNAWFNN